VRCESGEDNSLSKFVILLTREGRLSGQTPKEKTEKSYVCHNQIGRARRIRSRGVSGASACWNSQLFCRIIASLSKRRRGAGRRDGYKRKGVVCERTSASIAYGQALRLCETWCFGKCPKRGFMVMAEIFLSERGECLHHG
jgi:hypothetical protein